ncbi:MAG: hypothetical protein E7043_09370 [Lentisphaerae bacterium]|nr:hypothetical protein [Lentisphaerota bacterium]
MKLSRKQKLILKIFLCLCISCLFLLFATWRQPVGCFSILSLKTGKKVTIQPKLHDGVLNYLDAWCDKDTFFLTEGNRDMKLCYIMQYNMQGKKLSEYKLPFFTHSITGYGEGNLCAFYPAQKRFFYAEDGNATYHYYDLDSGEKGMIDGIETEDVAIKDVCVVNETLLLVDAFYNTVPSKKILYLIDIKEKKLVATREIPCVGWGGKDILLNISLSRLAVFPSGSNNIDVYDSRTLRHLFSIPKDTCCTDFAFSPSGNIMLQNFAGDNTYNIALSVENNHWEKPEIIFSLLSEDYLIINLQFYSDKTVLIHLFESNKKYASDWLQDKHAVEQLWLFDLRKKKIIQKYPVQVRHHSKIQGDYWIWEDVSRERLCSLSNCRLFNISEQWYNYRYR